VHLDTPVRFPDWYRARYGDSDDTNLCEAANVSKVNLLEHELVGF
jgi:hypothetical protein